MLAYWNNLNSLSNSIVYYPNEGTTNNTKNDSSWNISDRYFKYQFNFKKYDSGYEDLSPFANLVIDSNIITNRIL